LYYSIKTETEGKIMNKLKVCVIGGCGHSGNVIAGIAANSDTQTLCAYSGKDDDRLEGMRDKIAGAGLKALYYEDYKAMLDREKPDICVVDNVFYKHAETAVAALSRSIATYCEKPLALDIAGLEEVRAAQTKSGALLWAMQAARYDPWFYTAYHLIQQGVVGEVRLVNAQKSYTLGKRPAYFHKRETYGGTIPWVAIHAIDTVLFMAGKPVLTVYAVQSALRNRDHGDMEMCGQIIMNLEGQVGTGINFDFLRPSSSPTHGDDRVRVAGTEGILEVRGGRIYLINKDGASEPSLQEGPTAWEAFVGAYNGKPGLITTEGSIEATRAALLARESADNGKAITIEV
jgi:predicted dehydrogenase